MEKINSKVKFFNIEIDDIELTELLKMMKKGIVFTPNVDHIVKLQKNKLFYNAYSESQYILCDSKILKYSSFLLGQKIKNVIPGSDFFPAFYNYHRNNPSIRIFLLGAAEGIADKARFNINGKVGREIIVGSHSPSYGFEKNEEECADIISIINKTNANVLVVGVGAPKQEIWINKYKSSFTGIDLFFALGATIDFEAGVLKRSPQWMSIIGIEWLFRLTIEPKRLWKRYLYDDLVFFYYMLSAIIGKYSNPFLSDDCRYK